MNEDANGAPVADGQVYRVTTNSFLAAGGDNFTIFREGRNAFEGPGDVEALERYIASAGRLVPPQPNRIRRLAPR